MNSRSMKNKFFLLAVMALFVFPVFANDSISGLNVAEESKELSEEGKQSSVVRKKSYFSAKLGYGIGGTMPFPLPAEMRSINGFKPLCNFSIQGIYHRYFNDRAGLKVGVILDRKGMVAEATVKNYSMSIADDEGGVVTGRWTGDVQMRAIQTSLTLPLALSWNLSQSCNLDLGPYFAFLLSRDFSGEVCNGYLREGDPTGAKIEIGEEPQTFNFSEDMRRFQWGISLGVDWAFYKKLGLFVDLNWGLNNIFQSDFETITFNMYPIYGVVGLSYSFF